MPDIERQASQLLDQLGIGQPPVPAEAIAENAGATIRHEPYDGDVSGLVYREGSVSVIGVNSSYPETRQRFIIAHELGHLLLHRGRSLIVDKQVRIGFRDGVASLPSDREEVHANVFAAALLTPRGWVEDHALRIMRRHESLTDDQLVACLADTFQVGRQAMGHRLINLGLRSPGD